MLQNVSREGGQNVFCLGKRNRQKPTKTLECLEKQVRLNEKGNQGLLGV